MAAEKRPKCAMAEMHRVKGNFTATFSGESKECFFREELSCRAMSGTGQQVTCPLGFKAPWEKK